MARPGKKRRTSGKEGYDDIPVEELLSSRGQTTPKKGGKKPDTASGAVDIAPSKEGREAVSSKDEREANRSGERGVKLPPLQADTVSAKSRSKVDDKSTK